jgi:hypothetical protein
VNGSGGDFGGDPSGAGAGAGAGVGAGAGEGAAGLGGATTGSSGARLGCGWILSISRFASSQASKFCSVGSKSAHDIWSLWRADLLTPLLVDLRHGDTHLPHIRDFLSLKPIQVRLDRRRRVLQVLRRNL